MLLRYTGKTGNRRVNGKRLSQGVEIDIPDADAEQLLTMWDFERAEPEIVKKTRRSRAKKE